MSYQKCRNLFNQIVKHDILDFPKLLKKILNNGIFYKIADVFHAFISNDIGQIYTHISQSEFGCTNGEADGSVNSGPNKKWIQYKKLKMVPKCFFIFCGYHPSF